MSQLKALQKLFVGGNQLQYSDVEFIIESFPQLTVLGINNLGLTGRFSPFAKVAPVLRLTHISALPDSIAQLSSLQKLNCRSNKIEGTIYF
jgi:Leucine-rich repeat (LRR) protein